MKQVGESGIEDYIGSMWNIIDFLMLTFLLASSTLDVVVPIKVGQAFSDNPLFTGACANEIIPNG
jgi:hypothetical protein